MAGVNGFKTESVHRKHNFELLIIMHVRNLQYSSVHSPRTQLAINVNTFPYHVHHHQQQQQQLHRIIRSEFNENRHLYHCYLLLFFLIYSLRITIVVIGVGHIYNNTQN